MEISTEFFRRASFHGNRLEARKSICESWIALVREIQECTSEVYTGDSRWKTVTIKWKLRWVKIGSPTPAYRRPTLWQVQFVNILFTRMHACVLLAHSRNPSYCSWNYPNLLRSFYDKFSLIIYMWRYYKDVGKQISLFFIDS